MLPTVGQPRHTYTIQRTHAAQPGNNYISKSMEDYPTANLCVCVWYVYTCTVLLSPVAKAPSHNKFDKRGYGAILTNKYRVPDKTKAV